MGNIRCLSCGKEITMISGMECPNCKAQLSHVKIAFLSYVGSEDSLAGYQRSYKLVLLKCLFQAIQEGQPLSVSRITELFRNYYMVRKQQGLPADKDVDVRIENAEQSDLRDIWHLIYMNPFAAVSKHGFLKVKGDGLNGTFVLQKGIDDLSPKEIENLLTLLEKKLELYYTKIGSHTAKVMADTPVSEQKIHPIETKTEEQTQRPKLDDATTNTAVLETAEEETLQKRKEESNHTKLLNANNPIEEIALSTRAYNALKRAGIHTVGELAKAFDDGSLAEIRNIGRTVVEEIAVVLRSPQARSLEDAVIDGTFASELPAEIAEKYIDEMFVGGTFNLFVQYCHMAKRRKIKDIAGFQYEELLRIKGLGRKKVTAIIDRCKEIEKLSGADAANPAVLEPAVIERTVSIHETNWKCGVEILRLVGISKLVITAMKESGIGLLGAVHGMGKMELDRRIEHRSVGALMDALDMFSKPFADLIDDLAEEIASEKSFDVYMKRAEGRTLQSAADLFGITRERVRQICTKLFRKLSFPGEIIAENLMEENGGRWFRKEQLYELIDNPVYAKAFAYMYENNEAYYCVGKTDLCLEKAAYPNVSERLQELAADIVGDGINIFDSAEEIEAALDEAGFEFITADDFLGLLISLDYKFYGDYVLKDRKSYGRLCAKLVEEYFPDGISSGEEDMSRLRELAKEKYGELDLPESNRAVFTRICDHLILRGRSKYIAPKNVFVDHDILDEIKQYIDNSKQKDIFYMELFAEFEGLLTMMTNIDNYQFLHGVLRYYYPADYSYSRDCLSKESGEAGQSLTDRITTYVTSVGHAVSKKEILRNFPGISEAVLFNAAYNFHGLLQWEYHCYNSLENLHLTDSDVRRIEQTVRELLDENDGYCSEGLFYEKAQAELADILEKASMQNGQNLFYTAQELLGSKFEFRNPHIAHIGRFPALKGMVIAAEMLREKKSISLAEFYKLTNKLKWAVVTAGLIFTELEQDYIRTDSDMYVKKEEFTVSDDDMKFIQGMLAELAGDNWYLPLQLFAESEDILPNGMQINEFLIGSIASINDLGWRIIAPQVKDRRYQRGILVKNEMQYTSYDQVVAGVLKEQGVTEIYESDLLSFLMIRSLALRYIPKDLQASPLFAYSDGMYKLV